MKKRADSTTLFLKQIGSHTEELARLLALGSKEAIASDVAERMMRSTKMLEASASVLELESLKPVLQSYCHLLRIYVNRGLNWDERIAQLTSELIEVEDQWFSEGEGKRGPELAKVFTGEQLAALMQEIDEVRWYAESAVAVEERVAGPGGGDVAEQFVPLTSDHPEHGPSQSARPVDPAPVEKAPAEPRDHAAPAAEDVWVETASRADVAKTAGHADAGESHAKIEEWANLADQSAAIEDAEVDTLADGAVAPPADDGPDSLAGNMVSHGRVLDTSIGELRRITESFLDRWQLLKWDSNDQDLGTLSDVRSDLFAIGFHAHSIERMIGIKIGDPVPPRLESLAPIMSALDDFAQLLSAGTERNIEVAFTGENNRLDVRLLEPAVKITQGMIADIVERCTEDDLRIDVVVEERRGILRWMIRDTSSGSIADTSLDPDDYPVYYRSLRETYRTIENLHSVLWVEPSDSHDARFAFNMPTSPDNDAFIVWGEGDQRFAVLATQLSAVLGAEDLDVQHDHVGEHLMRDGHRIPLLRLRQLCNDAEVEGSRIAIIGDVETRIAFYVGSDGEVVNGAWEVDAIPAWHGVRRGVVQIGDTRATILEAADLLDRYQALVSNPPDTSAAYGEPREGASGENTGNDKRETDTQQRHVLVIERSEGLQQEFSSILSSSPLRAKIVGDIDSAIESLSKELPTLIISEFRVPSMAAKMLVERLKADGVDIPVIVTTAHDGNNAETLVQKLGVAGYISKPLKASEVMKRIDGALTGRVGRR